MSVYEHSRGKEVKSPGGERDSYFKKPKRTLPEWVRWQVPKKLINHKLPKSLRKKGFSVEHCELLDRN